MGDELALNRFDSRNRDLVCKKRKGSRVLFDGSGRTLLTVAALLVTGFAADQLTRIVIVLDDINIAAFSRISLNDRKFAISEFFDGLDLAIEVVIMKFADQDSMRVFLDQINLPIKIPIALDFDEFVVVVSFDNVGPSITVGVDRDLVVVFVDAVYPLVRASVTATVRNRAIRFPAARDEAESQQCKEDRSFPHDSL